jgi:TonB family protein
MKTAQTIAVFADPPASIPAALFANFEIKGRKRPSAFVVSYGIQAIVVVLLLIITLTTAAPVLIQKNYSAISLVAPTLSNPSPVRKPIAQRSIPPVAVSSPALPVVVTPMRIPAPPAPRVERTEDLPAPPTPKPVLQPNYPVQIPAMPVAKPVHTGSFGDPNGVPVRPPTSSASRSPVLASVGSFGTPATGMGRSGRGVATGEFGTQSGAYGQTNKSVKSVDFSEPALAKAQAVVAKVSPIAPVAIQSKPAPVYTEEARRLRVEGDVVVQVVFSATGEIRIVGVVKGLGHGLDEAAVAATRQIRFTPARRDGQFVDYPATIHVVFALS